MYTTDSAAKSSCNNDDNCKMVTDTACNGKEFKTWESPKIWTLFEKKTRLNVMFAKTAHVKKKKAKFAYVSPVDI